jgi:hypothetical protein
MEGQRPMVEKRSDRRQGQRRKGGRPPIPPVRAHSLEQPSALRSVPTSTGISSSPVEGMRFPAPADVPRPGPVLAGYGIGFGPITGLDKPVEGSAADVPRPVRPDPANTEYPVAAVTAAGHPVPSSVLLRMDALARDKSLLLQLCRDALALAQRQLTGKPWTLADHEEQSRIEEAVRAIENQ